MIAEEWANEIGGMCVEDIFDSDNLTIVLASYFERHIDHPEDDDIDNDLGWSDWVIKKTNEALKLLGEQTVQYAKRQSDMT